MVMLMSSCTNNDKSAQQDTFNYSVDKFADIEVLRYQVPGFEELSLQEKKLIYYLTEAALQGRDILFDQNGKYNLVQGIGVVLEASVVC